MAFKRPYMCDVCNVSFIHTHLAKGEPVPDCPTCALLARYDAEREAADNAARFKRMVDSGIPPGVRTNVSRAVENTHAAMEEMGYSDFKDNTRPGESIIKEERAQTTPEVDEVIREVRQYAEQKAIPHLNNLTPQEFQQQVKTGWKHPGASVAAPAPGAMEAKQMGAEPISMIDGARLAPLTSNLKIQGRAKKD